MVKHSGTKYGTTKMNKVILLINHVTKLSTVTENSLKILATKDVKGSIEVLKPPKYPPSTISIYPLMH